VLVNKADGGNEAAAEAFAVELGAALALVRRQPPHVALVSARTGRGVPELFTWLDARLASLRESGALAARRREQLSAAFSAALSRELLLAARADARFRARLPELEAEVASGERLPTSAARALVRSLLSS
jgi:LAO/AO transport system kinase